MTIRELRKGLKGTEYENFLIGEISLCNVSGSIKIEAFDQADLTHEVTLTLSIEVEK